MSSGTDHGASGPPEMERGAFVISIDTEMAWGEAHQRGDSHPLADVPSPPAGRSYDGEREVIARILDIFARHEITATWALVAHLFLDECHDDGAGPHPEIVRPNYSWLDGDWFDIDPCTSLADEPSFYGRDIVDAILACPTPQEIGCHSFSHLIVDDPACTPEVFASDLAAAAAVAAQRGVEMRSFVYPRNLIAHIECLNELGYRSYRGRHASPSFADRPTWLRPALRLVDRLYPLGGSAARPVQHASGIWNIPQSYYLFGPSTSRRLLPTFHTFRPIARLRQAARHRSLFHLWFHPHNVIARSDALRTLEHICATAAGLRDAGSIDIVSMGGLASQLDAARRAA